jgi:predicted nuclease of predicted toxin-antitoxin system
LKIKTDENVPRSVVTVFRSGGHEVDTVADEGLSGTDDDEVLSTCVHEERLLVTLDRGFSDVRRYPPGTHRGIIVLRVNQSPESAGRAARALLATYSLDEVAGCVTIVQRERIRVRRPA